MTLNIDGQCILESHMGLSYDRWAIVYIRMGSLKLE
jgi:hypothetical protein